MANKLFSKKINLIVFLLALFFCYQATSNYFAQENSTELLHFVHISDTHVDFPDAEDSVRLRASSEKLLRSVVRQINKIENLDFVLATGDLINTPEKPLLDKFLEITKYFKYPLYVLLGNHDVGVNVEMDKKNYIKQFYSVPGATSFKNKMPYYSFSPHKDFLFICLDGTTEEEITSNGQMPDSQLKWLKNEIESNKDKFIIIASHYPLVEPFKSKSHCIKEADKKKLLNLINKHSNVVGYFSGHYHASKLIKLNNKIYNSCPAIIQYPCAFREIIVMRDDPKYLTFKFKWHVVSESELVEKSKNASKSWILNEGLEEDRENTIKVRIYN